MKIWFLLVLAAALFMLLAMMPMVQSQEFSCTQVIGYSQTWEVWPGWESEVDSSAWEIKWQSGGAIRLWADPSYVGWNKRPDALCNQNVPFSEDRIVLSITMDSYEDDPALYEGYILQTLQNIEDRYPNMQEVILQPVIGGPGADECYIGGRQVRANHNHPYIDQAITSAAASWQGAFPAAIGYSPEVDSCSDYADWFGHIADPAEFRIGQKIGTYYAGSPPLPTPTPTPTLTPTSTPVPTSEPAILWEMDCPSGHVEIIGSLVRCYE